MKELARKAVLCRDLSHRGGLLEERGPNGELLARHVHGPSVDDLVLSELNGAVYYYHQDHLNSTIAVTDESGNVVEQYRYDVYGQPSFFGPDGNPRSESSLGIRFLFTGREWLASLALYDYRHRAYSPSLGRFLQLDPLGFAAGEMNLYQHAHNSLAFRLDPWGLDWDSLGKPFAIMGAVELFQIGNTMLITCAPELGPWALLAAVPFYVYGGVLLWGASNMENGTCSQKSSDETEKDCNTESGSKPSVVTRSSGSLEEYRLGPNESR